MILVFGIILIFLVFGGWFVFVEKLYKKKEGSILDYSLLALLLTVFQLVVTTTIAGLVIENMSWYVLAFLNMPMALYFVYKRGWTKVAKTIKQPFRRLLTSSFVVLSVVLFVILHIFTLARITYAPPNVFDSQVYHLPISIEWYQNQKMELFEDVPVGRFNYATKAPKMLNYWFIAFNNGDIQFVELSQYLGLVLLMLAVAGLLKNMGASMRWSVCASILVAFIPIIVIESHTLQDHLLLTSFHFTLIKLIFDFFDGRFKNRYIGIVVIAISLSLLLAGKFSAPAHVISIFFTCGVLYLKDSLKIAAKFNIRHYVSIACSIAIVMAVGGMWYIANYLNYGSLFGPSQPQAEKEAIFITNIMQTPGILFESAHRYTPDLINISGYGPFAVTVGLVCSVWVFISNLKNKKVVALFISTVLLHFMYFYVYLTPYNYRLLIFSGVSMIILGIYYISLVESSNEKNVWKNGLVLTVKLLSHVSMIFILSATIYTDYFGSHARVFANYFNSYPEDRTVMRFDYTTDKFKLDDNSFLFIDQYIPMSEPILYITQHEPGYDDIVISPYYGNQLQRTVVWGGMLDENELFNPDGTATDRLVPFMRERGISYLHSNVVFFFTDPIDLQPGDEFIPLTKNLFYLRTDAME